MARKTEVADDFRIEERDRVGGDGIAEAGVEFLGDRCAADLSAALEHDDFEPRGSEIGRGDKAIVTPANDDDVAHRYVAPGLPRRAVDGSRIQILRQRGFIGKNRYPLFRNPRSGSKPNRPGYGGDRFGGERTATNSLPCSRG